jgi:hypothetical protein
MIKHTTRYHPSNTLKSLQDIYQCWLYSYLDYLTTGVPYATFSTDFETGTVKT